MNDEKHKDLIRVLSQSLPGPPREDDSPLPDSLLERVQDSGSQKRPETWIQGLLSWVRNPRVAAVTFGAVAVMAVLLVARSPEREQEVEYGLRGGGPTTGEQVRVIFYQPAGLVWEEFQELADVGQLEIVGSEEALQMLLVESQLECEVVNFQTAMMERYVGSSPVSEKAIALPRTGIELLSLIEERKNR